MGTPPAERSLPTMKSLAAAAAQEKRYVSPWATRRYLARLTKRVAAAATRPNGAASKALEYKGNKSYSAVSPLYSRILAFPPGEVDLWRRHVPDACACICGMKVV